MEINNSDLYNGLFEMISGIFATTNIYRIVKDKQVRGISVLPMAFFTMWGIFNWWFYPHNDLWFSFFGGLLMSTVNLIWVALFFYYKRKNN